MALTLPTPGGSNGTWGIELNDALADLEAAKVDRDVDGKVADADLPDRLSEPALLATYARRDGTFLGDWKAGIDYPAGSVVRHRGSMWRTSSALTGQTTTTTTRTNYENNPTFRVDRTGWTVSANATGTVTAGTNAMSVLVNTSLSIGSSVTYQTTDTPAVPGEAWSGSIRVSVPSDGVAVSLRAAIGHYTPTNVVNGAVVTLQPGDTAILTVSNVVIPAGKTTTRLLLLVGSVALPVGAKFTVSQAIFEKATTVGDYFDGASTDTATADYVWTGTANASTSTATVTSTTLNTVEPGVYSGWQSQGAAPRGPTRTDPASTFTATIDAQNTAQYPGWLDEKNRTLLLSQNQDWLYYSRNDGTTWTQAHQFTDTSLPTITSCRVAGDGEVLVGTKPADNATGFALYRSTGFQASPTTATWAKIMTSGTAGAYPAAFSWSIHENIVLVSEYGPKRSGGAGVNARYLYLSVDYGRSFTQVYDLGTADGTHIHGVAYDPYWDRIWLCHGDDISSIVYSDNLGETWDIAQTTSDPGGLYQSTVIQPMPECVLFGTDGPPNGVIRIDRAQGKHKGRYTLDTAYLDNAATIISHICQSVFRAKRLGDDAPAVFYFGPGVALYPAYVLTTMDGWTFTKVWQDSLTPTSQYNGNALGPTASGRLIITAPDSRYGSGRTWWRGQMPAAY